MKKRPTAIYNWKILSAIFGLTVAFTISAWWVFSKDTCAFYANAQITTPIDETRIRRAMENIPGVFPSQVSVTAQCIEIFGTISTAKWRPAPGPKIKTTLENLGLENVSVSGYH